jgi:hypothetical protein
VSDASTARQPVPVHPLLFAAVPVLLLFSANVREQIPAGDVLAGLGVVVGSAAAVLGVLRLAMGDVRRAALCTSLWVALFFGYGPAWNAVRGIGGPGSEAWMLAAWAALVVAAVVLAARAGRWLGTTTRGLNAAAVALVAINLVTAATALASDEQPIRARGGPVTLTAGGATPDVYYIVMDRYGAAETLRERFGFDNAPFLEALRRRGFYVAEESVANYPKTSHSLAASLNMGYLGFLTEAAGTGSDDWGPVYDLLQGSRVAASLQRAGYRYVHIGSRWDPTRLDPRADVNHLSSGMSEFAQVLYGSTLLGPLARHAGVFEESLDPRERERRRTLFQFQRLAATATDPRLTFTFTHVLLPHEPYVFEADGSPVTDEEDANRPLARKFVDQVRFANRKLLALVDTLLAVPAEDRPIVLIQGDEGPHPPGYFDDQAGYAWAEAPLDHLRGKLRILNAYFLPGMTDRDPSLRRRQELPVWPTITPVNSFRVVFAEYFGADLALLPDRAYVFRDERHLYDFVEVTDRVVTPG